MPLHPLKTTFVDAIIYFCLDQEIYFVEIYEDDNVEAERKITPSQQSWTAKFPVIVALLPPANSVNPPNRGPASRVSGPRTK